MAKARKVFSYNPRPTWLSRLRRSPAFPIVCLLIGTVGASFGALTVLRPTNGYRCLPSERNSVSVAVTTTAMEGAAPTGRHKVRAFVGVQTGFASPGRRRSLRKTWFPSDRRGIQRWVRRFSRLREASLEDETGLAIRFVIGRTEDRTKMGDLEREIEQFDDFLLLDVEEKYSGLPYKTLAFFRAAYALFDADFYVKADDDIYLRPDRLSLLLGQDRPHTQTYLGCMKKGPVFTDPNLKWYEPLSYLLGREYFLHAYGPIYALSADVVASLAALKNNSFRMFSNEDVTIGAWMLAMNVNHEHEQLLCQTDCTPSSIAVWDIPKCSGWCFHETLQFRRKAVRTPQKGELLGWSKLDFGWITSKIYSGHDWLERDNISREENRRFGD
ncbi:putative beta-1,3-galactosyltransferase 14 [Acorus calamus]|uniref:Hexosyltransferase n=1 Tax=Acorus calamus TaxID=4465 RepID=A0AAV9FK99_ACOCL|nr:putative beta-1,3-galactosyltransferase 14 [Acorus calamus]